MVFGLTACASSTPFYYKQGSMLGVRQKDYDACKIKSFKDIPQNIVTTYTPGVHDPGNVVCSTTGTFTNCQRIGGVDIPASSTSYDVNASLRARFITQCMADKGYQRLDMPTCALGVDGYDTLQKTPALRDIKCISLTAPSLEE